MDYTLLEHLTLMRDTYRFDARHCGFDMEQQRMCLLEYRHYERRIDNLWRQYEGGGAIPAHLRSAREGSASAARERREAA